MGRPASSDASTKIWYRDLRGFLADDKLSDFWPRPKRPLAEQVNAGVRFVTYYAFVLFVLRRNVNVLFLWLVTAGLSYVVFESHRLDARNIRGVMERLNVEKGPDGTMCVPPTRDNPFMNVTLSDYETFPNRPKACRVTSRYTKSRAEREFDHNLYVEDDDIFRRKSSSRQFYTTPSTTIPNDQTAFAKWCYGTGPSCKERLGGPQCYKNLQPYRMTLNT